jgi:hypothetical protein
VSFSGVRCSWIFASPSFSSRFVVIPTLQTIVHQPNVFKLFFHVINSGAKRQLSAAVRDVIPFLAVIRDGALIHMLNHTIDGLTPMQFVADLKAAGIVPNLRELRFLYRKCSVFALPRGENPTNRKIIHQRQIRPLITARVLERITHLPPLKDTDDDTIPRPYAPLESQLYVAKKEPPIDLDPTIVPPEYRKHHIGRDYYVISER